MSLFHKKDIEHMLAGGQGTSLKKTLGALDLTFLGIGAIIGTGIFVLTGTGTVTAGPALTLAFIVVAIACGFAALAYAEFSSSIPVAGSIYTYSYATLGELVAWLIGWDLMLEYGLATSAVSVGWSGYLQSLLAGFGISLPTALTAAPGALPGHLTYFNLPAFLVMMAITSLLFVGVKESMRVDNAMVAIKVTIVLLVIAVGVFHVKPQNWTPFMPHGWSGVFGAAAVMFFAFIGFDSVSSAAEEMKNPKRDLPIGIIASLAVCAVLYVGVLAVVTGIVPSERFANVPNPVSFALQVAQMNWVAGFIDLGVVLGMLTVIFVMSYGQTRIIYAMSRDGLLPARLSKVHPKYATPFFTTWLVGIFFGLIGALVPLNMLAELINIGTLAAFSMVSIAVLILCRTHPELPRAFRCPVVPVLAVASCLFLMINLQAVTWIAFVVWLVIGLCIYFLYSRRHSVLASRLGGLPCGWLIHSTGGSPMHELPHPVRARQSAARRRSGRARGRGIGEGSEGRARTDRGRLRRAARLRRYGQRGGRRPAAGARRRAEQHLLQLGPRRQGRDRCRLRRRRACDDARHREPAARAERNRTARRQCELLEARRQLHGLCRESESARRASADVPRSCCNCRNRSCA